jgi:hypothetical protein
MECHNETPSVATLNKQKCHLFFTKNREQEGKTGPVWVMGTSGGNIKKGALRVNMWKYSVHT